MLVSFRSLDLRHRRLPEISRQTGWGRKIGALPAGRPLRCKKATRSVERPHLILEPWFEQHTRPQAQAERRADEVSCSPWPICFEGRRALESCNAGSDRQ